MPNKTTAPSDSDLEKLREKNEKLREQIADANNAREEQDRENSRVLDAAKLRAEAERLEHELAIARELAKASTARDALAEQIDQVHGEPGVVAPTGEEK